MIKNKHFRVAVCSLLVASLGLSSSPAFALSGNVIYSPTTGDMITRATSSPALTPELNQTYQRTMRIAQTRAAAARAAVGIVRGLAGSLLTIGTLVILASDVKGIWSKDSDGKNVLKGTQQCTGGVCSEYQGENAQGNATPEGVWYSTKEAACAAWGVRIGSWANGRVSPDGSGCAAYYTATDIAAYGRYYTRAVTKTVEHEVNDDELETLIRPDTKLLPLLKELDTNGSPVPFPGDEVEDMPQPIVISPTIRTNPDGSKTVTQTTLEPYRTVPDGPVQWRKKESVTETSKPAIDGTTTTTTATTTTDKGESATAPKPAESPAVDSPLPAQPVLYKQKYPNGISGVWQAQRDLMANSPLFTIAKSLMPTVGLGGSCPTMPVNLSFSQWANFGTRDVAPPCVVWDWGKAICIVSACLLARRLIFGG